jgi:hypothetical protein
MNINAYFADFKTERGTDPQPDGPKFLDLVAIDIRHRIYIVGEGKS